MVRKQSDHWTQNQDTHDKGSSTALCMLEGIRKIRYEAAMYKKPNMQGGGDDYEEQCGILCT
jgi:hypothetical protein